MKPKHDKQLDAAREALRVFEQLERKNCLAYEFVALKLGCSGNRATELIRAILAEENV